MKRTLLILLALASLSASGIQKGSSRNEVIAEFGEPQGSMMQGNEETLLFPGGTVTLQNGKVIEASLSQEHIQKAAERERKAEEIRAAQAEQLEKQKLAFPEDRVSRAACSYKAANVFPELPEALQPIQKDYWYNIYLPKTYYDSPRQTFPCLFLESPVLWDSVKQRIRDEKWVLIIMDKASLSSAAALHGNFLAAYNDATKRFRISTSRCFIAGSTGAAILSTLKPAAGIILHEPDFQSVANFPIDYLERNRLIRVFALLSRQNEPNFRQQAESILSKFPEDHVSIQLYPSAPEQLPAAYANQAIDWMKEQYRMP